MGGVNEIIINREGRWKKNKNKANKSKTHYEGNRHVQRGHKYK